jgi:L-seryl-tRNA(Ser) seleniumtransferase
MKKHPLYRALRMDKLTIAALEATLRVYSDLSAAEREIPVLAMLALSKDELRSRAEELCKVIKNNGGNADVVPIKSTVGGGSVPGLDLDSYAVMPISNHSASKLDAALRAEPVPIIGRIEKDRLLLDVRTILESDFDDLVNSITRLAVFDRRG